MLEFADNGTRKIYNTSKFWEEQIVILSHDLATSFLEEDTVMVFFLRDWLEEARRKVVLFRGQEEKDRK